MSLACATMASRAYDAEGQFFEGFDIFVLDRHETIAINGCDKCISGEWRMRSCISNLSVVTALLLLKGSGRVWGVGILLFSTSLNMINEL